MSRNVWNNSKGIQIMFEITGKYTSAKVMIDDVEESCVGQITQFVNHPAFTNPVAIMSDTHYGKGSVIGFTMPLKDKIVPNTIGVDIGCGMLSLNVGKTLNRSLEDLDVLIRSKIPFGESVHQEAVINMKNDFPWRRATTSSQNFVTHYQDTFGIVLSPQDYNIDWFMKKCESLGDVSVRRVIDSLGSLGGGNHFIELGVSENGDHWITIHTGSRNFGYRVCNYWQGRATKFWREDRREILQKKMEEIKNSNLDGKVIFQQIKDLKKEMKLDVGIDMKGCEWLEGELASGYLFDMIFAQIYAEVNREYIGKIICEILGVEPSDKIESVHNFIDFRDFIIRKGAIRSYENERFILPFNMRDGTLICTGKSNPEWNFSAPHGAGRMYSRKKAKADLSLDKFREQMTGIYSTSVCRGTLDESPDAYKDSKIIEEAIQPTATIVNRIKPILNMKDATDNKKR